MPQQLILWANFKTVSDQNNQPAWYLHNSVIWKQTREGMLKIPFHNGKMRQDIYEISRISRGK